MDVSVILMAVGEDRPGLTQSLADAVVEAGGNWLESHFVRMGDKFVGSVLVDLPAEAVERLRQSAGRIDTLGFHVSVLPAAQAGGGAGRSLNFELVGRDRQGIVQEVATALAGLGVNIEELETGTEHGAMSGEILFRARARVLVPEGTDRQLVQEALEQVSGEIMVDLSD